MPVKFTTAGKIGLWRGAQKISEHASETSAVERAITDWESTHAGRYTLKYPDKELDLSDLSRIVYQPDVTPPSTPTGLVVTPISETVVNLSWNAAADVAGPPSELVSGIAGYRVYRNGVLRGTVPTAASQETGLTAFTLYSWTVSAIDGANNESPQSTAVQARTLDTTGPAAPVITATQTGQSSISVALVTPSTDVGSGVASYSLQRATDAGFSLNVTTTNGLTGASFPVSVTGLSGATQYYFRARATDNSSNTGAYSATATATTQAVTGGLPDFGWQVTASNVGLARLGINGASLPLYTPASIIPAGTVVTDRRITASLIRCHLGNIRFERCLFQPTTANGGDGYIYGYNSDIGAGNQAGNLEIIDCDIDGSLIPGSVALWKQCAIRATGTFQRTRIWGFGSGIAIFGSNAVQNALVEHLHCDGFRDGSDSHNEASTIRGFNQTSLIIRKNWFHTNVQQSSGAMFIQPYTSNVRNSLLEANYMSSPTNFDLYIEVGGFGFTYSNMQSVNNRFLMAGLGVATNGGPGWSTWSNNFRYNAATPPNNQGAVVNP